MLYNFINFFSKITVKRLYKYFNTTIYYFKILFGVLFITITSFTLLFFGCCYILNILVILNTFKLSESIAKDTKYDFIEPTSLASLDQYFNVITSLLNKGGDRVLVFSTIDGVVREDLYNNNARILN